MKTFCIVSQPQPIKSEVEYRWSSYWSRWARASKQRHGVYRQGPKYRKDPNRPKKEKDFAREDWRAKKGFQKDFRKRCRGCCSSAKGWAKKVSNHKHRQAERQAICKENWESLHIKTPKNLFDPWSWS